jgi:ABC-type uncharacterized transport system involved in gliding motility auxiliary subunit
MNKKSKIFFAASAISLICFFVTRFLVGVWIPFLWLPLALFAAFLIAGLYIERTHLREFFTMKTTKHGMNMGVLIALVVVVLGVVNFLSVRHYKVWDFSGNNINTLSDQSVKLIKSLDSELLVRFFYKKGTEGNDENRKAFRDLVKKYQDQSPNIKLEFVEVNERPDLAETYGVNKGSGVVFLEYKGRKNRIEKIEEQEFTNALVKVIREKDKNIYFITGHGERDLEETKEALGLNAFKVMLENNRYVVKPLAMALNAKIPDDADLVAIVGPTQKFLDYEIQGLQEYLKRGGSLFVALKSKQTQGLEKILGDVGITPMNNYVLNLVSTPMGEGIQQGQTVAMTFSPTSEITKVFGKNEFMVFRNPMSFKRGAAPEGTSLEDIVRTDDKSMAFDSLEIKGEGPKGPFTLAMSAKGKYPGATDKEFELVTVGDADFLGNQLLYQNLNRDLALNSMAYLAHENNLISIAPKEPQVSKLTLTDSNFYLFLFAFAIPLPLLLLGVSATLWTKRRHA